MEDRSPMHKLIELFQLADKSGIKMPESAVLFARTFSTIDVIALELVPGLNIPAIINEFFRKFEAECARIEDAPNEEPFYLQPELDGEWAEVIRSFEKEAKSNQRELLVENASAIMESFRII